MLHEEDPHKPVVFVGERDPVAEALARGVDHATDIRVYELEWPSCTVSGAGLERELVHLAHGAGFTELRLPSKGVDTLELPFGYHAAEAVHRDVREAAMKDIDVHSKHSLVLARERINLEVI